MTKRAVLIGINYIGTDAFIRGCVNDVRHMHKTLIERFGFSDKNIKMLIDTDTSMTKPTGKNIIDALVSLVEAAKPGDVLFVHYSGHGTRLPAETGEDDDTGYDECIVPCDMNLITDDDFRNLVNMVPKDCPITIISDSCHSGGLIDEEKEQIGDSTKKKKKESDDSSKTSKNIDVKKKDAVGNRSMPLETLIQMLKQQTGNDDIEVGKIRTTLFDTFGEDSCPKVKKFMNVMQESKDILEQKLSDDKQAPQAGHDDKEKVKKPAVQEVYAGGNKAALPDNGILISGCQTDETSADSCPDDNPELAFGALSNAIEIIVKETKGKISNKDLVMKARKLLKEQGFDQQPGLYCKDGFVKAQFIC